MREVKLGLVQMTMVEDRAQNIENALRLIRTASTRGAQIVCLPELFETLYFPQHEDAAVTPQLVPNATTDALSEAARQNGVVLVAGSVYEKSGDAAYNTSIVFDDRGGLIGKYRKVHIPQDPGFYEQDYFTAGTDYAVFETRFGRVGVLICFDQWYPEPARVNKLLGAEILFYPTAIGTVKGVEQAEGDWKDAWEGVQRGHAIANSMVVATVNRAGVEGETDFWGGSFVYDQFGTVLARAGDEKDTVFVVPCDLDLAGQVEQGWGFLRNRQPGTYQALVK